jgi:hypothetical protein
MSWGEIKAYYDAAAQIGEERRKADRANRRHR